MGNRHGTLSGSWEKACKLNPDKVETLLWVGVEQKSGLSYRARGRKEYLAKLISEK